MGKFKNIEEFKRELQEIDNNNENAQQNYISIFEKAKNTIIELAKQKPLTEKPNDANVKEVKELYDFYRENYNALILNNSNEEQLKKEINPIGEAILKEISVNVSIEATNSHERAINAVEDFKNLCNTLIIGEKEQEEQIHNVRIEALQHVIITGKKATIDQQGLTPIQRVEGAIGFFKDYEKLCNSLLVEPKDRREQMYKFDKQILETLEQQALEHMNSIANTQEKLTFASEFASKYGNLCKSAMINQKEASNLETSLRDTFLLPFAEERQKLLDAKTSNDKKFNKLVEHFNNFKHASDTIQASDSGLKEAAGDILTVLKNVRSKVSLEDKYWKKAKAQQEAINSIRETAGMSEEINAVNVKIKADSQLGKNHINLNAKTNREKFKNYARYFDLCNRLCGKNETVKKEIGNHILKQMEKIRLHDRLLYLRDREDEYIIQQETMDNIRKAIGEPILNKANKVAKRQDQRIEKEQAKERQKNMEQDAIDFVRSDMEYEESLQAERQQRIIRENKILNTPRENLIPKKPEKDTFVDDHKKITIPEEHIAPSIITNQKTNPIINNNKKELESGVPTTDKH